MQNFVVMSIMCRYDMQIVIWCICMLQFKKGIFLYILSFVNLWPGHMEEQRDTEIFLWIYSI